MATRHRGITAIEVNLLIVFVAAGLSLISVYLQRATMANLKLLEDHLNVEACSTGTQC